MAISYDDFAKVQLRVATILNARALPENPAIFELSLDLGDQKRQVQAELGGGHETTTLAGKQAVVVVNLGVQPPAPAAPATLPAPAAPGAPAIPPAPVPVAATADDVARINLRVAQVLECKLHPNADKLIVLQIAIGEDKRQICAGLKAYYQPEQMVGRQIVVVENLEPRKMRGEISQGMLLAASDPATGRVIVVCPAEPAISGSAVVARGIVLCAIDAASGRAVLITPSEPVAAGSGVK